MESSNLDPEFYGSEDVLPQSPPLVAIEPEKLTYTPETVIPPSELCLALDVGVDTGLTPFAWTNKRTTKSSDYWRPHALDGLLLSHMSPNCPEISLNATGLDSFGSEVLYDSSTRWSDLFWESEVLEDEWTPGISFERNKKERSRTRVGLPITLETVGGPATVLACADTGAEENIISADLATTLRLPVSDASSQREFMLASGKIVQAIGQVSALCSFGLETSPFAASIRCIFHVFLTLASPIIMGTAFLDETDTMTTYRERLVRIRRPNLQAPQVYSLGRPRNNMMCYVDGELIVATPDTGSDLDIMTPQFAKDRGLQINDHEEVIEFADGSTALTCGSVQVDLAVRRLEVFSWKVTISKKVDIFLLDQFVHDILIGMDSLEELKVFTENKDALIPVEESSGPLGLHHIRSRGRLDAVKSWVNSKIRSLRKNHPAGCPPSNTTIYSKVDDQRENHRRDIEEERIASLPLEEQDAALEAEALKQIEYDKRRVQRVVGERTITSTSHSQIGCTKYPIGDASTSDLERSISLRRSNWSTLGSSPPSSITDNLGAQEVYTVQSTASIDDSDGSSMENNVSSSLTPYSPGSMPSRSFQEHRPQNLLQIAQLPSHGTGNFKCDHPGCAAAPFQTQYLLNSHANVHWTSRPHYCPVESCPRGPGGRGFKRKNEMIRHGLVHDSPGYVCPFCPGREHKYPRPENLERHVRVHHVDKQMDDPLVRKVLPWKPERGSRGRRRRVDSC